MSLPAQKGVRPSRPKKAPVIYVVDDEPVLLDLAEMALAAGGYDLKKFLDPEEALDSFVKAKSKPVLLITDYALGKMNGLDLIERCKALKPNMKSILISGTAGAEIILESGVQVDRFMGKPYQPAGLAELVRRVLASADSAS